jgi:hypothetical protein
MHHHRALFLLAVLLGSAACSEPQDLEFLEDLTDAGADADAAVDACADAGMVGDVCSAGEGACERAGTYVCMGGEVTCDAEPGKPSDELCDTERDEDCDGHVDEAPENGCCDHEDCGKFELCSRPAGDAFAAGTCMSFERPNADCTRDGDDVSCKCHQGYYDDDGMCSRNACVRLKGEDPPCAPNQSCEPEDPGEKSCSCKKGFEDCDKKDDNGCEQALDDVDHCGACDVACDARASCSTEDDETRCICDRPLIGDGSSCIGFGPISAGFEVTCGIRITGALECFPASAPMPPSGTFKQLAVGATHHCALGTDGAVACWGSSDNGADDVPTTPANDDYVQVVVGNYHTCALKDDGTPVCWGISQTNPGSTNDHGQSDPPRETFHQLAAGGLHTCGLRDDGTVRCWGAGLTEDEDCMTTYECGQALPPDKRFIQITAGLYHTCGLRSNGAVLCWGAGATDDDQSNSPNHGQLLVPSDVEFTSISAGGYHTCGIDTDDKVTCWGAGSEPGAQLPADFEQSIAPSGDYLRVAAGTMHTCALTNTNQVRCWGGIEPSKLPETSTAGTWPVNP